MPLVTKRPLTTKEVAAELGISWVAVQQAVARGRMEVERLGNVNLVSPAEVERYRRKYLRGSRPRKDET